MKVCSTCNCRPISFPLDLTSIGRDEKLPFIERVLGLLIESRFANGHAVQLAAFSKPRDIVTADCFDLHPRPLSIPLWRKRSRSLVECVKNVVSSSFQICDERIARLVNLPSSGSPSTLGRGSPKHNRAGGKPAFLAVFLFLDFLKRSSRNDNVGCIKASQKLAIRKAGLPPQNATTKPRSLKIQRRKSE